MKNSALLTRRQFFKQEQTIVEILQLRLGALVRKFGPVDLYPDDFAFTGRVVTDFVPPVGDDGEPKLEAPAKMTLRWEDAKPDTEKPMLITRQLGA